MRKRVSQPSMFVLSTAFLVLLIILSGCVGIQRTELRVKALDNIETSIGKNETLEVRITPLNADVIDVWVNTSTPKDIMITDETSKNFKTLPKGKESVITFNYTAKTAGTFSIGLWISATNANATQNLTNIISYVPVPKLEIGEYWVFKQKEGDKPGLHVIEMVRKETIDNKECYVFEETWEGEPEGAYSLMYRISETGDYRKEAYYENDELVKEKTIEVDPVMSEYGFPFRPGKNWTWSGTITGVGKAEMGAEVIRIENVTTSMGTYLAYYTKAVTTLPIVGTITQEWWYVPELNTFAKLMGTVNVAGVTKKMEVELVEHGLPPNRPKEIQLKVYMPGGYKLYKDTPNDFAIAYPKNWKDTTAEYKGAVDFAAEDGDIAVITVATEYIGLMDLEEYMEYRKTFLEMKGASIVSDIKTKTFNKMEGYVYYFTKEETKGRQVMFVKGSTGYTITGVALKSAFENYDPIFENIFKTFYITGKLEV